MASGRRMAPIISEQPFCLARTKLRASVTGCATTTRSSCPSTRTELDVPNISSDSGNFRRTVIQSFCQVHLSLSTAVVHSFVLIIPDRRTQIAGYSLLLAFLTGCGKLCILCQGCSRSSDSYIECYSMLAYMIVTDSADAMCSRSPNTCLQSLHFLSRGNHKNGGPFRRNASYRLMLHCSGRDSTQTIMPFLHQRSIL